MIDANEYLDVENITNEPESKSTYKSKQIY